MGDCTRCGKPALHPHVGAIHAHDAELCSPCFTAWQGLGESVRMKYVAELAEVQARFLGRVAAPEPEQFEDAQADEVIDLSVWHSTNPAPPEPEPVIEFTEVDDPAEIESDEVLY